MTSLPCISTSPECFAECAARQAQTKQPIDHHPRCWWHSRTEATQFCHASSVCSLMKASDPTSFILVCEQVCQRALRDCSIAGAESLVGYA
eukprot:4456887-Amphidinium_carterae.4